jgi:citrate synthase
MTDTIKLVYGEKEYELPVVEGSEGEKAINISQPGYANTGSCSSSITFMDGEKGILRYRGIPVEELAEKATFKETAYLLK